MTYRLLRGRVERFAAHYHGPKAHALLCDPPYHLTSISKRFGKPGSAPAQEGTDGVFGRSSRGFMGKQWDGGDLCFQPDLWAALAEHLYPGAFGMAFASSRGWHRLAVAIEDAGLIIHPSIFGWAYAVGFPKATRIDTQLDKAQGVESFAVDAAVGVPPASVYGKFASDATGRLKRPVAQSDLAQIWEGHRYGLQALKPSLEPIIVFQKPYEGRPIDNIVNTGAGALAIDNGRIGTRADAPQTMGDKRGSVAYRGIDVDGGKLYADGRWPANLVTVNADDPSDFFFNADWALEIAERLADADPVRYEAKASTEEREAGLQHLPIKPGEPGTRPVISDGGLIGNREKGFDHNPLAKVTSGRRNTHPTVKPIALIEWLASLLLPPDAYAPNRRILVPFAGSGSEMIGCMRAGWDEVIGIEMEAEYVTIAKARLAYYAALPNQLSLLPEVRPANSADQQAALFDLTDS